MTEKKNSMLLIIITVIAAVIGGAIGKDAVRSYFKPKQDMRSQSVLNQVAHEINKSLPMMIDKDTEMTATLGLEGVLVYNYRFVNHSAGQVDAEQINITLKPRITNAACTTPDTRDTFLKKGVALRYNYYDKNNSFITRIDIQPKDCGF